MIRRTIQGVFESEADLTRAAQAARQEGWPIVDIYTPYALHGTAKILGIRRSRLPRAAFVFGALGVALAFWFQFWVSASDWPLNVGGRPWNSLPAFVPVAFETMVLFAGVGIVLTWIFVSGLFPGKRAVLPAVGVTDDRFVLVVQSTPHLDPQSARRLFQGCNASRVEEGEGL
jgi:hypothetical protein